MNTPIKARADLNVLIVEDEHLLQNLLKSVLISMGLQKIDVSSDGQSALQAVASKKRSGETYDVIICDWDMPIMNGITFLETFRKSNQSAVVIMVTARSSSADFNEAKLKGADYFFMKPLEAKMLKIRLGAALDAALARR